MSSPTDSASHIGDLDTSLPQVATCTVAQLDDFIRHLKTVLKTDFANVTGAVTPTHTELNFVDGVTSAIQTQLDAKAPLASPTFTGTPTLPTGAVAVTQSPGDNDTSIATTAFVTAAVAAALAGNWVLLNDATISGSPSTVDFVHGSGGVVLDATYDEYQFTLSAVKPGTDNVNLLLRTSTNGGSSYSSTAGDYNFHHLSGVDSGATVTGAVDGGTAASIPLASNIGNASGEDGAFGEVVFFKPSAASAWMCRWALIYRGISGDAGHIYGVGLNDNLADVDAIRFLLSSGTFSSGRIKLFGRKL